MRHTMGTTVVVLLCLLGGHAAAEMPKRGYFTNFIGGGIVKSEDERPTDVYTHRLGMIRWAFGVELGRPDCGTNHRIGGSIQTNAFGDQGFSLLGLEYSADWPLSPSVRVGPRASIALAAGLARGRGATAGLYLRARHLHLSLDVARVSYDLERNSTRSGTKTAATLGVGLSGRPSLITGSVLGGLVVGWLILSAQNDL